MKILEDGQSSCAYRLGKLIPYNCLTKRDQKIQCNLCQISTVSYTKKKINLTYNIHIEAQKRLNSKSDPAFLSLVGCGGRITVGSVQLAGLIFVLYALQFDFLGLAIGVIIVLRGTNSESCWVLRIKPGLGTFKHWASPATLLSFFPLSEWQSDLCPSDNQCFEICCDSN